MYPPYLNYKYRPLKLLGTIATLVFCAKCTLTSMSPNWLCESMGGLSFFSLEPSVGARQDKAKWWARLIAQLAKCNANAIAS